MERFLQHRDLVEFQLRVAEQWMRAALDVRRIGCAWPHLEFVACFAALNAIYWLWGVIDKRPAFSEEECDAVKSALSDAPGLRERVLDRLLGLAGEQKLLRNLVDKLGDQVVEEILAQPEVERSVNFFKERGPIQRMDKRFEAAERPGDNPLIEKRLEEEGRKLKKKLDVLSKPRERLRAVGEILYIVRCNLVHGSKVVLTGPDPELLEQAVPPLRLLTEAALALTKSECPWL